MYFLTAVPFSDGTNTEHTLFHKKMNISFYYTLNRNDAPSTIILGSRALCTIKNLEGQLHKKSSHSRFLDHLIIRMQTEHPMHLSDHKPTFDDFLATGSAQTSRAGCNERQGVFVRAHSTACFHIHHGTDSFTHQCDIFQSCTTC